MTQTKTLPTGERLTLQRFELDHPQETHESGGGVVRPHSRPRQMTRQEQSREVIAALGVELCKTCGKQIRIALLLRSMTEVCWPCIEDMGVRAYSQLGGSIRGFYPACPSEVSKRARSEMKARGQ